MELLKDLTNFLFCFTASCSVSHQNLSRVIWQSSVHSWEVELYQDLVFRNMEKTRNPKKRSAPSTTEEQTPRPAKKWKASHEGTLSKRKSPSL